MICNWNRYCTDTEMFSVLTIDTTYNCGELYVTSSTFRDLRFIHTRIQKPPTRLGPVLIHTSKSKNYFRYMATTIIRLRPSLRNSLFIGSDRDRTLSAFLEHMPLAVQLLCKKHAEDDITRRLQEFGVGQKSKEILRDIFGDRSTKGMVNFSSSDEFDQHVNNLNAPGIKPRRVQQGPSLLGFSSSFAKHKLLISSGV